MKQIESLAANLATVFISAAVGAIGNAGGMPTDWPSLKRALLGAAVVGGIATYHWLMTARPKIDGPTPQPPPKS
jgi:hypothetical protein